MISFIIFGFLLATGTSEELPEYLEKCSKSDPNLSSCLLKNSAAAIKYIADNGDSKYQINSLTPIKYVKLNLQATPRLKIDLANVDIIGTANMNIKDIQFTDDKMVIKATLDRAEVNGDYDIRGQILVLPINGNGKINLTLINLDAVYTAELEQVSVGNDKFYKIKDDHIVLDVDRIYYDLTNLFNGDKRLGPEMNRFLNENWSDVYGEIRQTLSNVVGTIFNVWSNGYFKKVPVDKIIGE